MAKLSISAKAKRLTPKLHDFEGSWDDLRDRLDGMTASEFSAIQLDILTDMVTANLKRWKACAW